MSSRYSHAVTHVRISFLIILCMYLPHFVYPFICQWTLGLLPPFSYCEQCCYEHECTNISLNPFSILLGIHPEVELLDHVILFNFFEELPYCFPQSLYHFTFLPTVHKGFNFFEFSPTPHIIVLFFFFLAAPCVMRNFPDQGLNLCPLQWKRGVLTTGPPGKSHIS